MAGIDHNIIGQLRPLRVESPVNALAQVMQLQNMQQQGQMSRMQMEQAQEARRNELALNEAYKGAYGADGQVDQNALMRSLAQGGMGSKIPGIQKQMTEAEKARVELSNAKTTGEAAQFKLKQDKVAAQLQRLQSVGDPQTAQQWIMGGLQDGLINEQQAQQALQRIPQDQAQFAQWKQGQITSGMTIAQQMEQEWKKREFARNSANDVMTPDGKGGFTLNQPLIAAKQRVAKAGASTVNVNATQEKEESKAVGKYLGEQFADIQKAGIGAQGKLDRAARMEQLLGKINTGKFEGVKKDAAAIAQALGVTIDPNLGDKEAFEALSNALALEMRNPSGGAGMPGALSDKDREFLVQMTPNLTKTQQGNRTIIETSKKLAKREAEVAKMAREYRAKHKTLDEGFFEELRQYSDKTPLFQSGATATPKRISNDAEYSALPSGSEYIAPDGSTRRKK